MKYTMTRIVKSEFSADGLALYLLEVIENSIAELEKLPKEALSEWDSVFEEVAVKFSNLNLKVLK